MLAIVTMRAEEPRFLEQRTPPIMLLNAAYPWRSCRSSARNFRQHVAAHRCKIGDCHRSCSCSSRAALTISPLMLAAPTLREE
jgi:hypothetical protein